MKILQQEVMEFLMGLNDEHKTIRGSILRMPTLRDLYTTYHLIYQNERQRNKNNATAFASESAALVYTQRRFTNGQNGNTTKNIFTISSVAYHRTADGKQEVLFGLPPSGRSKYFCDNCKISGHSIDKCFKVNGSPQHMKADYKGKKIMGQAHSSIHVAGSNNFNVLNDSKQESNMNASGTVTPTLTPQQSSFSLFSPRLKTYMTPQKLVL